MRDYTIAMAKLTLVPSPDAARTGELIDADPRRFIALRVRKLLAEGQSPVEFLLVQMQNKRNTLAFRAYCAVQASPYVHQRLAPADAADADDPHQRFMDELGGMREKLAARITEEVEMPTGTPPLLKKD